MTDATEPKRLYSGEQMTIAKNINAYLLDADDVFVESRNKPVCHVPDIGIGNKPIDGGNYLFSKEEMSCTLRHSAGCYASRILQRIPPSGLVRLRYSGSAKVRCHSHRFWREVPWAPGPDDSKSE